MSEGGGPPPPVTEGATVVARDEARKPQERLPVEGARAEAIPIDLAGVCGVVPAGPLVPGKPPARAEPVLKPWPP